MAPNNLPETSNAMLIAAPVFRPKVETIPTSMGTSAKGIKYFGVPAFLGSVIAAIENVKSPVAITWKVK